MLAPALQDDLDLSLTQVGVLIAAPWVGAVLALLPWGLLADRIGERIVLAAGTGLCGVLLLVAAEATAFHPLVALMALAGAAGASVNAASGRAVMSWFKADERGLALGIRQSATPLGGILAAVALPVIEGAAGLEAAFGFLGAVSLLAALTGAIVVRDLPEETGAHEAPGVLRNPTLWLIGASGALYIVAQTVVIGFLVLYLHDQRGFSTQEAAAVLGVIHAIAIAARIAVGRWSDLAGSRIAPLRLLGLATFGSLAVTATLLGAAPWLVVSAFVVSGVFSMSWNGLSFTAAAEVAGRARSGAAIGFQQTVLVAGGAVVPPAFAALVDTASWRVGFAVAAIAPLAGWALLAPLKGR